MTNIFIQETLSSHRHLPSPLLLFTTPDLDLPEFKWTRFVQGSYHPEFGFLAMDGITRIPILIYSRSGPGSCCTPYEYQRLLAPVINALLIPKTLTAIHYRPNRTVDSIVVGVDLDAEATYPWHLKHIVCNTLDR